jgi:hypothetical protein
MNWFGNPWPSAHLRAPICMDDSAHIPTPVGSTCYLCSEVIVEGDQGTAMPGYIDVDGFVPTPMYAHKECGLRNVMGCYGLVSGEAHTHDVPYREDALRVQEWVQTHG